MTEKKLGEEPVTYQDVLDLVNTMYKAENDNLNDLYTLDDLQNTPFELTFVGNIAYLINEYRNASCDFANHFNVNCKLDVIDKPDYKTALENNRDISVAKLITKQSLIIK